MPTKKRPVKKAVKKMNIDQALRRVSRIKGELVMWQQRLAASFVYEKGKEPAFSYKACLSRVEPLRAELVDLASRIAEGNARGYIQHGARTITLCRALRLIAELKGEIAGYQGLLSSASSSDGSTGFPLRGIHKERLTHMERESSEVKLVPNEKGHKRPERVPKMEKYTVVSEVTITEASAKLEVAQEALDALNAAVNAANHATLV